jgi:hypothetical protein
MMSYRALVVGLFVVSTGVMLSSLGCNSILGNEEGAQRTESLSTDGGTANADSGIAQVAACDQGKKSCFGLCVAANDPATGCGGASCVACDLGYATATCAGTANGFACGVGTCNTGFADCDKDPANGCEASLSKPKSCGSCTNECPTNTPLCSKGACTDTCGGGETNCDGSCVDTTSSVEHCGGCATLCQRASADATCVSSKCQFTCKAGTHDCGGACVPIGPASCGNSCVQCPVYPNTIANCDTSGGCGVTCQTGWIDCDGDPSNGCEFQGTACPVPVGGGCNPPCTKLEQCCSGQCAPLNVACIGPPPAF